MKIIRDGNVYVQLQDLGFLDSTDEKIPASIYQRNLATPLIYEKNAFNWERFSLREEVEFLNGLDFIVDYDQYKSLSLAGIEEKLEECATEINKIVEQYNQMSNDEKISNQCMLMSYEKMNYKFNSISYIYNSKNSHSKINLPKKLKHSKKNK